LQEVFVQIFLYFTLLKFLLIFQNKSISFVENVGDKLTGRETSNAQNSSWCSGLLPTVYFQSILVHWITFKKAWNSR